MSWRSERTLWRLCAALLGGRTTLWMFVPALVAAIVATLYVLVRPVDSSLSHTLLLIVAKMGATVCFLAIPIAAAQLRAQVNLHPLLHLAPGAEARLRALLRRLAVLAAICFVPALLLAVYFSLADRADPGTLVTLINAESYVWRGWTLYLLGSAIVVYLAAAKLRVPLNFIWAPVNLVAYQPNLRQWWLPFAFGLVFLGVPWLYQRLMGEPPKRMRMLDENAYLVIASPPSRFDEWRGRLRAWRLRRLVNARPERRALALAIFSQESRFLYSWVGTLSFAFALAFVPLSWLAAGGKAGYALLGMLMLPLVLPQPVRLASLWVLPLGPRRPHWGDLLVSVWMHPVRYKLVVGVLLGLLFMLVREALLPGWGMSTDRSELAGAMVERFILEPLFLTAALHGTAYVTFVALAGLWLRLYRRSTANSLVLLAMVLAPILLGSSMWAADALASRLGLETPSFVGYALLTGGLLPLLAWAAHRAQRSSWAKVDIATLSDRFEEWQRQLDRATTYTQDTSVSRRTDGEYVVQRRA